MYTVCLKCVLLIDKVKHVNIQAIKNFKLIGGPRSAPDSKVRGPGFDTWSGHILSFPLLLIQEGQMSVTGKSMCTKHSLIA